jgi:hypothetical protein
VPDLPVAVYRFLQKAMAKDPNDRYLTAQEFTAALDRLDFSEMTEESAVTTAVLSAHIGHIAAEDRGSALSRALGRAVRHAQRRRTPTPGRAAQTPPMAAAEAGFLSGWRLWVLVGAVAAVLVGGAVVAAVMLAPNGKAPAGAGSGPAPRSPAATGNDTPASPPPPKEGPGEDGGPETKATPPEPPPEAEPEGPDNALEAAAMDALRAAKAYETKADRELWQKIQPYREVVEFYPGTKAAALAREAIRRLQADEELPSDPPPEEPPPEDATDEPPSDADTSGDGAGEDELSPEERRILESFE